MNKKLISTIISPKGIRLIQALPTKPSQAMSVNQLIKKSKVSISSAYRIMAKLTQWANIGIVYSINNSYGGRPYNLYYIKRNTFSIKFTPNGVDLTLGKK